MKLISESFVKPRHEVEAAKNHIYLKPIEILMLGICPVRRGLLYPLRLNSSTLPDLLKNLKHSLSIALLHFYPLAGQFVTEEFANEQKCTVFIDYNAGPGARLTHVAATNLTIKDLATPDHYVPYVIREFFDLGDGFTNNDGHTRPLLSIQVTQLQDGIFIGFSMNHSVADGTSLMHFLSMLSEIFCLNNTNISRVPLFEDVRLVKFPYSRLEGIMTRPDISASRVRVFHFSLRSLGILKAKANQESIVTVSTLQGLVSLVWRSITRVRNLAAEQETAGCMMVNARCRLEPPLSNQYFGNYISQAKVICKVGELLSHDLGWDVMRINEGVKAQVNNFIRGAWDQIADNVTSTNWKRPHRPNVVIFGGSARFDTYGLDFGLGKAVTIYNGDVTGDGTVNANPGFEGGGNIDLTISLKDQHMAALEVDQEFMAFTS